MTKLKTLPVAYVPEKLHIHKYIVKGYYRKGYKYFYAANLKEAKKWVKDQKEKCCAFEIFEADHEYKFGYYV